MPKSEAEIEQSVRSIVGSMAISGFTLTEEDIENCRAILKGELDGEAQVQQIIAECRKQNGLPELDPDSAEEDIQALKVRVDDLLDRVDLANDIDAAMASTIARTEMDGGTMCNKTKKYVVLIHRKEITTDEHRRLIQLFIDENHAKTQN